MGDELSGQGGAGTSLSEVLGNAAVADPVAEPVVTPTFDYSTADGIR